ncbi:hypothetical protein [Nocardia aurantia]|uniref:CopG family transcriptional regulator n=1 Tax=Nocardia aurantia TaxID=2585199 RepID=A0A7K0DLM4_9NOCA|nr:hypothetical protein [Nocardia aurantia]MQY26675.1 hypothetical protein [Nocardia aurantia]
MQTDLCTESPADLPRPGGVLRVVTGFSEPENSAAADVRNTVSGKKYSIILPEELAESVRSRIGSGSFSSYVRECLEHRLAMENLSEIVSEFNRRNEPLTEAEIEAAHLMLRTPRQDPVEV